MREELKPCPFCGEKIEPPKSRPASSDRSEGFVAFAACYCGGYSATAHKMGRGNTEAEAIQEVIALWNRRAQPAEAEGVEVVGWLSLDVTAGGGWRASNYPLSQRAIDEGALQKPLMTVEQHERILSAVTAERNQLRADRNALADRVAELEAALDHIGGLSRALRVGGPDPIDLEGLSEALTEAVDTAHAMLAGNTGSQVASAFAQEWVDARTTP